MSTSEGDKHKPAVKEHLAGIVKSVRAVFVVESKVSRQVLITFQ